MNAAQAAYGALWCMVTDNPSILAAKKHLLSAIGGQGSEAQRAAIQWAGRHLDPPSDAEIAAIDDEIMAGLSAPADEKVRVAVEADDRLAVAVEALKKIDRAHGSKERATDKLILIKRVVAEAIALLTKSGGAEG